LVPLRKVSQIKIEHHFVGANQVNVAFDPFKWYESRSGFHNEKLRNEDQYLIVSTDPFG